MHDGKNVTKHYSLLLPPLRVWTRTIIFRPFLYYWRKNIHSKRSNSTLLNAYLPIDSFLRIPVSPEMMKMTVLTVKVFHHQIIANLPQNATKIRRNLKSYEIWVFLKSTMVFAEKNLFSLITGKEGKFALKCVSNDIISQKGLFHLNFEVFLGKNQNIFNFGKIGKYMKQFFRKKIVFIFLNFKKHF